MHAQQQQTVSQPAMVQPAPVQVLQQPQPAIIYTTTPPSSVRENYAAKTSLVLGIIQIVIGGLAFILQIVAISFGSDKFGTGAGFWCGIIFVIAGIFGVKASKNKTTCHIVSFMVFSILAVEFALIGLLVCSAINTGTDYEIYQNGLSDSYGNQNQNSKSPRFAVDYLLITLSLVEFGTAIFASAICCNNICCYSSTSRLAVIGQPMVYGQVPQQVVVMQPGQPGQSAYYVQSGTTVHQAGRPNYTAAGQPPAYQPAQQPGQPQQTVPFYPGQQAQQQPMLVSPNYQGQQPYAAVYEGQVGATGQNQMPPVDAHLPEKH